MASLALATQSAQSAYDKTVDAEELVGSVSRTKVLTPSPRQRVEIGDDGAGVRLQSGSGGQIPYPRSHTLHRPPARPAMQEVQPLALLLPDPTAQALVQVTTEKVKALFAIVELDSPCLLRVQLKSQTLQDHLDTPLGLLALPC